MLRFSRTIHLILCNLVRPLQGPTDGALIAPGSTVRLVVSVSPEAVARPGFDASAAMAILETRVNTLGQSAALYSISTLPSPPVSSRDAENTARDDGSAIVLADESNRLELREKLALRSLNDADACAIRVSFEIPAILPLPASTGSGWSVILPGLTLGGEAIAGLPLRLAIAGTTAVAVRAPQSLSASIDGNYVTPAVSNDGTIYIPQHKLVHVYSAAGSQLSSIDVHAAFGISHVYAVAVDDERGTLVLGSSSSTTQLLCVRREAGHAVVWASDPAASLRTYGIAVLPGLDRIVVASYGAVQFIRTFRASDGAPLESFEVRHGAPLESFEGR